jgi:hypothetical protein
MRRLATLALLVCLAVLAPAAQAMERAYGFCSQGGVRVYVSNVGSTAPSPSFATTYWQQSYPNCTVTVYLTGTTTLATIYSDNSSTPLANPFTASSNGYWKFYAADGRYDVRFSGTGITSPFTTADILLCDPATCGGGGGGGTTPHNLLSTTHPDTVPYSPPVAGDTILGGIPSSGLWQRFAGNTTTTRKVLTQLGNGSTVLSQDWTTIGGSCGGLNSFITSLNNDGSVTCNTATASNSLAIQWNGSLVGTQPNLNFIDGSGVTFTVTNDSANSRVNVQASVTQNDATYQKDAVTVGQRPRLNFLTSASVTPTVTDNPGNTSVDVSFAAQTAPTLPPPFFIPAGQAVAFAYPSTCFAYQGASTLVPFNPLDGGIGSATDANLVCATPGGSNVRYGSGGLHENYNFGLKWGGFAMPTLPSDAVIQHIYPVSVMSLTGTPIGFMTLNCASGVTNTNVYSYSNQTNVSGYFASSTSLGATSGAVTAAVCVDDSASSVSASGSYDNEVNAVALAIYYTTATPPTTNALNFFLPATYPTLKGIAPAYTSVSDGVPINWDLANSYISNGITTLNHVNSTRTLNVSNMPSGGKYWMTVVQDSTGGAAMTLGTGCTWYVNNVQTTTLGLPTTANLAQSFSWTYDGSRCFVDTMAGGGGGSGSGFAYLGAWSNATLYVANNIVSYNGSSYIALSSNSGVTPGSDGGVTWAVLAAAGAQGPAGQNGLDGTNGTNGAPGAPGYSPNQVLSGCGVAYQSGLTFTVSACSYIIQNVTYGAAAGTATLATADPSLDRIDAIVVNTSGAIAVVTGTPSGTPAPPSIDISSQLQLTFAYIAAGATTPSNVTSVDIYHENAEWTCASTANVNCASTTNPHSGTKDIEATNAVAGNNARLTIPAGSIDVSDSNNLVFWIRSKATWANGVGLTIQWYNGSTAQCTPVTLINGNFGFASNITSAYQQVVIPTSVFSCAGVPVTQLRFTRSGTGSIGFYLDDIILQGGVAAASGSAAMIWRGTWSFSATYAVNDTVKYQNLTYTATQTNTNSAPSANPANWSVHSPAIPGVSGNVIYNCGTNLLCAINSSVSGSDVTFPGKVRGTAFESTDTVNNTEITGITGSGGDSTCPTPVAGTSYLCIKSNAWNLSNNGGAYAPIGTGSGSGTVTSIATTSPITGGTITTTGTIACATCVVASSPGAGIARFAGSTQTVTSSELSGDATTSGSNAVTLATKYKTHICEIVVGDPGAASPALADDNDTPRVCGNITGADITITAVACYADAGSPTVTPILTGGSGTSVLTGALTCGTASWAAGTINGTPTVHSFSANGATCSSTPCTIDANITSAGGTAKYIVMHFTIAQ